MENKILFIVNPTCNKIDKNNLESLISRFVKSHKFKWEIYYTKGSEDDKNIQHKLNTFQPGKVIVAGGDGTVNLVAPLLLSSKTELGIIPAGSANGLAFNLDIPNNFEEALSHILQADSKPLDIIKLNEKFYCLHLSDIGINARIVKRFEDEESKGLIGYGKQMLKELFSKKRSFSFYLETSELKKKYKAEMVVIANARRFGTGAVINPVGRFDDGVFEIVVIKPYPWWIIIYMTIAIFFGEIDKLKYVKIIRTGKATIKLNRPQDIQSDGEIIPKISVINLRIIKSAVKVLY